MASASTSTPSRRKGGGGGEYYIIIVVVVVIIFVVIVDVIIVIVIVFSTFTPLKLTMVCMRNPMTKCTPNELSQSLSYKKLKRRAILINRRSH